MSAIAIIPARGGSKRIARKNIKAFLHKPIIAYPIQVALESHLFDEIMVSTDDDEIAAIAASYGAKVPFRRTKKNADDSSTTADVIVEVLTEYEKAGMKFEYACCIYPTAPFIDVPLLKQAKELIETTGVNTVFTMVAFGHPIWRAFKIENGRVEMCWPENRLARTQDLQKTYHDAGQFYWIKPHVFMNDPVLFGPLSKAIEMDESRVHDIDTLIDWKIAELKYQLRGD